MKPQPMSESEIVKCLVDAGCIGTVKMTFESGPYDITRTSINADRLARAIEAHVNAQWAAMIGEPVGWQMRMRFDGREWGVWTQCEDHSTDEPLEYQEGPLTMQFRPLCAIKETP